MSFIRFNENFGQGATNLEFFIGIILVVWILLVFYSYKKDGLKKTLRYFLPMMLVGLFIESAGLSSGRYYYPGYLIYISVVGGFTPIIMTLGWSANLYLFLNLAKPFINKIYSKKNLIQIGLISACAGIFGICLDLLEDPIAHHNNWWVWLETSGNIKYFNVPLLNFIDWFIVIFFMAIATLIIDRTEFSENRKLLLSLSSTAVVGAVILVAHVIIASIL